MCKFIFKIGAKYGVRKGTFGQNHIIKHFENAIKMGKISHAYIINGEAGSGKMKLAVHFAKALQCEANNPDASDGNMQFDFGERHRGKEGNYRSCLWTL